MFGPSGSGKSTLVNLIAGLEQPDSGFVSLDGEMLFDSNCGINIPPEHRRIGIVFQHPHLFPHLSVRNNLLYGFKRCSPGNRRISLNDIVEVLGIGNLLNRGISNLSGGEKQRVAIGRAVLSNPRLLLLDEPLSGLDDKLKFHIIPFLKKICEIFNIPYIFISHSILELRIMADHVLSISDGRIAEKITAEELALGHMKVSAGFTNIFRLNNPVKIHGHNVYKWGGQEIYISNGDGNGNPEKVFELSSTEIILFKRHPEAISARNLIKCRVVNIFEAGHRIGIDLKCGEEHLIAEVVKEAVDELGIREGVEIYAAIKAVAFKRLF